jgi:hypothetical protein
MKLNHASGKAEPITIVQELYYSHIFINFIQKLKTSSVFLYSNNITPDVQVRRVRTIGDNSLIICCEELSRLHSRQ